MAAPDPRSYRRSLGVLELICLGVGGTIGSGIFVVPGIAAQLAGESSLLAWLLVALSACAVAFALGSLQARAPLGRSLLALLAGAFGDRAAALLVLFYSAGSLFGVATIGAGLGQYLAYLGIDRVAPVEVLVIAAMLAINLRGISLSGATENLLSLLKVAGIFAIIAVLAPHVQPQSLVPAGVAPLPTLLKVVVIVYWSFTGFEISAIPVAEMRNPRAIVPALVSVMALVCVVYLALNLVLLGAVGAPALAASPAPVAFAVELALQGGGTWVALLAIVTMLSALNAYIVGASRCIHDLLQSRQADGFARLSTRGVPAAALWITCLGATGLLMLSNRFGELAAASVLMTLVPYVALCWAAFSAGRGIAARTVALFGAIATSGILVLSFAL
jgi:amino acid efflux transporter